MKLTSIEVTINGEKIKIEHTIQGNGLYNVFSFIPEGGLPTLKNGDEWTITYELED